MTRAARLFASVLVFAAFGAVPAVRAATPPQIRQAAAAAFQADFPRAVGPCLYTLGGVGLQGSAAVWLGVAPGSAAAGGAAASAEITATGQVMADVGLSVCAPIIARLLAEYTQYSVPAAPDFRTVATVPPVAAAPLKLPPCNQAKSIARTYCARLESVAEDWVSAIRRSVAVAQTLETTVARESGAANASDRAAASLQQKAALALLPQQDGARNAEIAAYGEVAATIKTANIRGLASRAIAARTINGLFSRLAAKGLDRAALAALAGPFATPSPVDLTG